MQRILAITNQKGGVEKTTSAINIAAGLARKGKRVVLVDLDPQANLTTGLGLAAAEQTIYGALLGEYRLKAYPTSTEKLLVVAGSPALSGFEQVMGNIAGRELRLQQLLEPFAGRCDFVLLDCPPASGLITLNAYVCAQELYIPLEAQLYGTDGLAMVVDLVARIKQQLNPALRISGIFFTRYDKRKVLRRETADLVRTQHPDLVLNSCIRKSIALGEAPHLGKDIFSYAPQSAGAADYEALVTEILSR